MENIVIQSLLTELEEYKLQVLTLSRQNTQLREKLARIEDAVLEPLGTVTQQEITKAAITGRY